MDRTLTLLDTFAYRSKYMMLPNFHNHPEYEIYFLHSGACQYVIGDMCLELAPGDLIIMNGMTRHSPIMTEPCVRTMIRFDEAYVLPLIQYSGLVDLLRPFRDLKNMHWRLEGDRRAEVEHILTKMYRFKGQSDPLSFNRIRNAFIELLLLICECSEEVLKTGKSAPVGKETIVHDIIAFIEAHYAEELSLERFAASMHLNKFYIVKIFKEMTGITVFEYINKRRINQAKLLFLANNKKTVSEVCCEVGFKQITHFSRNFKREVGMTPEQFRKHV